MTVQPTACDHVPKEKSGPDDTVAPRLPVASSPTHATDLVPSPDTPVTVAVKDPGELTLWLKPAALTLAGVWA